MCTPASDMLFISGKNDYMSTYYPGLHMSTVLLWMDRSLLNSLAGSSWKGLFSSNSLGQAKHLTPS